MEKKKMDNVVIDWTDLVAAGCPPVAIIKWWDSDTPMSYTTGRSYENAYGWLKRQAPCWLKWIGKNKSGKVPPGWIDYIEARQKPKRTVEEIIEKVQKQKWFAASSGFVAGIPDVKVRQGIALSANMFPDDRKAMKEAVKILGDPHRDIINVQNVIRLLSDRLDAADKQAAEMGDK